MDSTNFLGNAGGDPGTASRSVECGMGLQFIEVSKLNFDVTKAKRQIKAARPESQPRIMNVQPKEIFEPVSIKGKTPSVLANSALYLMGNTVAKQLPNKPV